MKKVVNVWAEINNGQIIQRISKATSRFLERRRTDSAGVTGVLGKRAC